MGFKKSVLGAVILIIAASSIFVFTDSNTFAQNETVNVEVSKKLDDILANQKLILDEIAIVKGELNIIKIRITQNQ